MWRTLLWSCGALIFVSGGCGILPAGLLYTFTAGDSAFAQTTSCARDLDAPGSDRVTCSGTWRTGNGEQRSGKISGADREDIGHTLPIRTGPFGTYTEPITAHWQLYTAVPALIWFPYLFWRHRRKRPPRRPLERHGRPTAGGMAGTDRTA